MESNCAFTWDISMSVGEDTIDEQHKQLLAEVNTLLNAILYGKSEQKVTETLDFLDRYISEHFSYEEKYMTEVGYPGLAAHTDMHHAFIKKYTEFKDEFKETGVTDKLAMELQAYMGQWWVNHIKKEDKKYHLYTTAA